MTGPVARGPQRARAAAALVAWTAALAVAVGLLHALGGALAPPPLTDPAGWGGWLEGRQPAEAAFALLRLVALGLAWYLLAATLAATVARLTGAGGLVRAADVVTVPLVRRLVNGAVGAVVAVTLTGAGAAAAAGGADPPVAAETMSRLPDAAVPDEAPAPVMRRLPDDDAGDPAPAGDPSAPGDPAPAGDPSAPGAPPVPAGDPAPAGETTAPATPDGDTTGAGPPAPAAGTRTWTVRPGDHFWSVAERVLAEARPGPPTDGDVDPYWRALVEANRSMLRDPANPDLLFPGQVIVLPPVDGST